MPSHQQMVSKSVSLISKSTIVPHQNSSTGDLKLSVSDLPMLSCHYIQKGLLFTPPNLSITHLIPLLKRGLSATLSHFPPLAGRLTTDSDGYVYISCNNAGADFIHATADHVSLGDILSAVDTLHSVKDFFTFDSTVSYDGHFNPILAIQVTELADGIFIACSVNHAVVDGTSLWNFFNSFADVCRGDAIRMQPDFSRNSVLISPAVLKVPAGGPKVTFAVDSPTRERIFSFSRDSLKKLKARVNYSNKRSVQGETNTVELMGKQSNDSFKFGNCELTTEISSFQSLSALLWRAVTRARNLPEEKITTFRMAVNCRHRLEPKLEPFYFGNAIQSIPTYASAGEVRAQDLSWCAEQLHKNVMAHDNATVRRYVEIWENDPKCFPLGNFDGAMIAMGSSPRFPMYDNDFGWGKPIAIRSGRANKFDGKISAFPGRDGGGSVDLEVVLDPETMKGVESDAEFMEFVTVRVTEVEGLTHGC